VPACADRRVRAERPFAVSRARVGELRELVAVEQQMLLGDLAREGGGASAVPGVRALVLATDVVKEGEERHDADVRARLAAQQPAVALHARPVRRTVVAVPVDRELGAQQRAEGNLVADREPAQHRLAISTSRHMRSTSFISSTDRHAAVARRGSPTTTARHCARDTATLRRRGSNRNWRPRADCCASLAHIEISTTGASCPWKRSTLPTRAPAGSRASSLRIWRL